MPCRAGVLRPSGRMTRGCGARWGSATCQSRCGRVLCSPGWPLPAVVWQQVQLSCQQLLSRGWLRCAWACTQQHLLRPAASMYARMLAGQLPRARHPVLPARHPAPRPRWHCAAHAGGQLGALRGQRQRGQRAVACLCPPAVHRRTRALHCSSILHVLCALAPHPTPPSTLHRPSCMSSATSTVPPSSCTVPTWRAWSARQRARAARASATPLLWRRGQGSARGVAGSWSWALTPLRRCCSWRGAARCVGARWLRRVGGCA